MSEFVQLRSPYKISDLNLDRIATKEHQRKKKLIVKIYYKPNRGHHTDFLFQTPEILLKNSIKYNKKGHYELELPFLGKKHIQVDLFEKFITNLETKIIEVIKKHKEWFPDKNIRFKSIIRYPDSKTDLHNSLRLKIDSNTLITKNGSNIDLNNLQKDFFVKCILKVSYIYIKDSFATINLYPKLIDLREQKEDLAFAPESESDEDLLSDNLTTESEDNDDELSKSSQIVKEEDNQNLEEDLETLRTFESSTMDMPSEINNYENIVNNEINNKELSKENSETSSEGLNNSLSDNHLIEKKDENIENQIIIDTLDTDTSVISNINNSENFIESYNTNNINIKEININSEESVDSNYSEEINADEIKNFESELLSKS
jgi:hypothetical protein